MKGMLGADFTKSSSSSFAKSLNFDEEQDPNPEICDWDETIQDSRQISTQDGQSLYQAGPFNMDLVRKMNEQIKKSKKVIIATAGETVIYTFILLNSLLSGDEKKQREALILLNSKLTIPEIDQYMKDAREVYFLLRNADLFCNVKKGYDDKDANNPWIHFPEVAPKYEAESPWNDARFQEVDKVRAINKNTLKSDGPLLIDVISSYQGVINMNGNDFNDQTFLRKLTDELLVRADGGDCNISFTLTDEAMEGRRCFIVEQNDRMRLPMPIDAKSLSFEEDSKNKSQESSAKNESKEVVRLHEFEEPSPATHQRKKVNQLDHAEGERDMQ